MNAYIFELCGFPGKRGSRIEDRGSRTGVYKSCPIKSEDHFCLSSITHTSNIHTLISFIVSFRGSNSPAGSWVASWLGGFCLRRLRRGHGFESRWGLLNLSGVFKKRDNCIDRMHKWRPKNYSFIYVLIRLTTLVCVDKVQKKCCLRARLLSLIST